MAWALDPRSGSDADREEYVAARERGVPFLVFRDAQGVQRIIRLEDDGRCLTVGRSPDAEVALPWDDEVSRVHAELERLGPDWTIADDGLSRNGTFVNGDRVGGRMRLRSGDVIRIGGTQLLYDAPVGSLGETQDIGSMERPDLTDAQRKVLIALCRPYRGGAQHASPSTNQQIADELVLSIAGVKTHVRSLFERFGVEELPQNRKRARLVELAFMTGTITDRDFD
jgi:pSer/pThr/pTyr-binding forkhead associated (FHA) protein